MNFVRPFVETPRRRRGTVALAVLLCGGLLAAGTSVGGGFPFGGSGVEEPDLILVNGEILTVDQRQPRAGAIAITDDEITAVGSSRSVAKLAGRRTQTINLRGRTVIPGLVDGHTHAIRGGQTFDDAPWWPPHKIAGRELAPYLTAHPELRLESTRPPS